MSNNNNISHCSYWFQNQLLWYFQISVSNKLELKQLSIVINRLLKQSSNGLVIGWLEYTSSKTWHLQREKQKISGLRYLRWVQVLRVYSQLTSHDYEQKLVCAATSSQLQVTVVFCWIMALFGSWALWRSGEKSLCCGNK